MTEPLIDTALFFADEEAKPEHDLLSESFHHAIAKLGDADSKTDDALSRFVKEVRSHAANLQRDNGSDE